MPARTPAALAAAALSTALLVAATPASAATDNFDYPAGPLAGNNGGTASGGIAFTGPYVNEEGATNVVAGFGNIGTAGGVSSSDPFVEQGPGFSQQVSRGFTPQAGTVVYVSGLVSIGDGADDSLAGSFGGIGLYLGGTEKFLLGQAFSGTNFALSATNVGDVSGNGTSDAPIGDFDVALLVGKLDLTNNSLSLFVNPDLSQSEADNTVDSSITFSGSGAVDTVRLRGGSNDNTFQYDNLNITNTSPFGGGGVIPEPAGAALLVGGLALAGLRRRPRA